MHDDEYLAMSQMILNSLDQSKRNKKPSEDDKTFRQNVTNEITNRDEQYTELLSHFVAITKTRNCLKEFFKWSFYIMIILSIILFIILTYKIFNKFINQASIKQLIETIPLFMTSIIGFVSVIISIPIAITKYLFSTKEDENITKIILHTQDHDTVGRQWTLDFKKMNASNYNTGDNRQSSNNLKEQVE